MRETILRLRTVSLLPDETLAELDARFGRRFRELPDTARLALAAVAIENSVTHARLKEMSTDHPKDLSKTLASLVEGGFLVSRGATRGTVYFFPDKTPDATADGLVSGVDPALEEGKGLEQMPGGLEHSTGSLEHLRPLAAEAQKSKKVSQAAMQQMLVQLIFGQQEPILKLSLSSQLVIIPLLLPIQESVLQRIIFQLPLFHYQLLI